MAWCMRKMRRWLSWRPSTCLSLRTPVWILKRGTAMTCNTAADMNQEPIQCSVTKLDLIKERKSLVLPAQKCNYTVWYHVVEQLTYWNYSSTKKIIVHSIDNCTIICLNFQANNSTFVYFFLVKNHFLRAFSMVTYLFHIYAMYIF